MLPCIFPASVVVLAGAKASCRRPVVRTSASQARPAVVGPSSRTVGVVRPTLATVPVATVGQTRPTAVTGKTRAPVLAVLHVALRH